MIRIKPVFRIFRTETETSTISEKLVFQRIDSFSLTERVVLNVDVYEREDEIVVEVEVPGVSQRDVTVFLHNNRIEVRGMKRQQAGEERMTYFRLERAYGRFQRFIPLPSSVVPEKTKAFLENGILTVVMKKHKKKGLESEK